MNNVVFEKNKEKIREHRDIELVTTCKTRSCLVQNLIITQQIDF